MPSLLRVLDSALNQVQASETGVMFMIGRTSLLAILGLTLSTINMVQASAATLRELAKTPGDVEAIAERVIQKQFGSDVCQKLIAAALLGDDKIRAVCWNRPNVLANFLIMDFGGGNALIGLRCESTDFTRC